MYLKQIEIHGFKSFANNTVLNFEKGITGIVGPNGSGKSNIADAVRWVLGERSMKQLRGADTLDVIFSGTETRKAQGFAYVNLVIDNSDRKLPLDYNEVQVSRRLYRSGESEYKLNEAKSLLNENLNEYINSISGPFKGFKNNHYSQSKFKDKNGNLQTITFPDSFNIFESISIFFVLIYFL